MIRESLICEFLSALEGVILTCRRRRRRRRDVETYGSRRGFNKCAIMLHGTSSRPRLPRCTCVSLIHGIIANRLPLWI